MKRIILVPLEPLNERYTEQWYRRLPEAFRAHGFEVLVVDGTPLLQDEIKVGAFLDINSTVHYKMTQLQAISAMFHKGDMREGDIFFFSDIEFWGLESVRLMSQMNNVPVKITGFLHAASYTKEDAFAVAAEYQQHTELGWVTALDKVFVGSHYHMNAFLERRVPEDLRSKVGKKFVVTRNPLFMDEYHQFDVPKQKKVLLTNRFDYEKRPRDTLALFEHLKHQFPDWEFVVTTGRKQVRGEVKDLALLHSLEDNGIVTVKAGLTKQQYHQELAEAYMTVSHSIEENYGYCLVESIVYGVIPLAPRGLSHDELVPQRCLFEDRIADFLTKPADFHANGRTPPRGSDLEMAIHWMNRFGEPTPTMLLDTSGTQNIINELKVL